MKLLLDAHALLWFVLGDASISRTAVAQVLDPENAKFVSPASYWDLAIKIALGKYVLHEPYEAFVERGIAGNGFRILPIEPRHTAALLALPFHHRDPFDRLLASQALVERMSLVSADAIFDRYSVSRVW